MAGICDALGLGYLGDRPRCAEAKPVKGAAKEKKQADTQAHKAAREKLRRLVVRDDGHKCRRCKCRVYLRPSDAPSVRLIAHVHEWIWRSFGGSDIDPLNCLTLCADCHELCHPRLGLDAVLWQIVACDSIRLMRGAVEFIPVRGTV